MCILIVSCSVFLNWVCWARGNFSGEPGRVRIRVCESPLCGVPGRYEYISGPLLVWLAGLYGFFFLWLCFGGYGTIEQVGVAGQYEFSVSGSVLVGAVQLKWWGGAVFNFSLSLVCCQVPWRVDMRGRDIALFFYGILWWFLAVSHIFQLLIVDYLLQEVSENLAP